MILYHYKKKVEKMRKAIKRGLIVALGVIIQILLSLSVLIFFGQKIAAIETFYAILSVLLVLRNNKRK
jgi:cardiolipin synthase